MALRTVKSILVATFSLFVILFSNVVIANEPPENNTHQTAENHKPEKLKPGKILMEHIADAHDWHLFTWNHTHVSIPLPVLLYSPQRGFTAFSSGNFHHGEHEHNGYKLVEGKVVPVNATGTVDAGVKVYDFSITKNVMQLAISLIILIIVMLGVAKKYKVTGTTKAPSGFQNAIEPVITFIRDEVGKANLGNRYMKYMPYLLTVFFFILINNLFGLIPGSANVTGNIAFTMVLAIFSFLVILFSTNKHFWAHIFWYPGVPMVVRLFIMLPVELLGVFTKPFALMVRLFANMIAGHMVITSLILLIFIFGEMSKGVGFGFSPVSLAFVIFIYFIEILVAFIQAFIFTNLTAVFISQAFEGGHDSHEEKAHH